MDIMIRTRFDNTERAEACIKRIREADCPVVEIRLLAPPMHRDEDDNILAHAPVINALYPGTMGYGSGGFVMRVSDFNDDRSEPEDDDVHNNDAVVEVVAPEYAGGKIRSIIINAGGRDTVVF